MTSHCYIAAYDEDEDGRHDFSEWMALKNGEGPCPEEAVFRVLDALLPGGDVWLTGYIGTDHVSGSVGGNVTVPGGTNGHAYLSFTADGNASNSGTVRFGPSPGITYHSPISVPFDTAGDGVAHIEFEVDEAAVGDVTIPFTVSRQGMPDYDDAVALRTAESSVDPSDEELDPIEIGVIGGIVGLVLGALLVAVVMMAFRK